MIDIKFEINGRPVSPNNFRDPIEKAVMEAVTKKVRHKLASCRCPDHGGSPAVVAKGLNLKSLSFEVKGCCDKLIEDVKHRLT